MGLFAYRLLGAAMTGVRSRELCGSALAAATNAASTAGHSRCSSERAGGSSVTASIPPASSDIPAPAASARAQSSAGAGAPAGAGLPSPQRSI